MWYNEITFEEKAVKKYYKKRNFKNFKEKVDIMKTEWYIIHRYRKKGKKIYWKSTKKTFQKKLKKKLTIEIQSGILINVNEKTNNILKQLKKTWKKVKKTVDLN